VVSLPHTTFVVALYAMCRFTLVMTSLDDPTMISYPDSTFWGEEVVLGGGPRSHIVFYLMERC